MRHKRAQLRKFDLGMKCECGHAAAQPRAAPLKEES